MTTFKEMSINTQRPFLYKDQLPIVQGLVDFKEQVIIDLKPLEGTNWRAQSPMAERLRDQEDVFPFRK